MPTITAPLLELQVLLAAVAPYRSSDGVTPIITCINLRSIDSGGVTLLATDRYQVGEATAPDLTLDGDDGAGILLPPSVVSYIRSITDRQLLLPIGPAYKVTIDAPTGTAPTGKTAIVVRDSARVTVTVTNGEGETEQIRSFRAMFGHYPPLHRLFPDDTWKPGLEADILLSPTFLSNLSITARALTGKPRGHAAVRFSFFRADGAKKDRPTLITFDEQEYPTSIRARVLIQPYLRRS